MGMQSSDSNKQGKGITRGVTLPIIHNLEVSIPIRIDKLSYIARLYKHVVSLFIKAIVVRIIKPMYDMLYSLSTHDYTLHRDSKQRHNKGRWYEDGIE